MASVALHTAFFEVFIVSVLQWALVQWFVAAQWTPQGKNFVVWSIATFGFMVSSIIKIRMHNQALIGHIERQDHIIS